MHKITSAGIFLTQNCNFRCRHCLNRCPYNEEMRLDDYIRLVSLLKRYGLSHVVLTGGEPTLHRDFKEIIAFTARNQITFQVVSNGFLFESYGPLLLRHRPFFQTIFLSIDGLKSTHDRNRKSGSFDRVVEAIRWFKRQEVQVGISFTLTTWNLTEYEQVIAFFAQLGIDAMHVGCVIMNDYNQDFVPDIHMRRRIFWEVTSLAHKYGIKLTLGSSCYNYGGVEGCSVLGEYDRVYINQNSQLLYCCNIQEPYGRVSVEKVSEKNLASLLWKRMEITRQIREDRLRKLLLGNFGELEENTCEYCRTFFNNLARSQSTLYPH